MTQPDEPTQFDVDQDADSMDDLIDAIPDDEREAIYAAWLQYHGEGTPFRHGLMFVVFARGWQACLRFHGQLPETPS